MKVRKTIIYEKVIKREPLRYDFLTEWAIVRRWAQVNYKINRSDLEMLFFLHGNRLFRKTDFDEYKNFMPWDSQRFNRLLKEGWITEWRQKNYNEGQLYEVSFKTKKMITSIYKKLIGEEPIPTSTRRNKAFQKNAPFHQKTLAIAITDFNRRIKERKQRPSPEL